MEFNTTALIAIWNNYHNDLPVDKTDLIKYMTIIEELQSENPDFNKIEKHELLNLVEILFDFICANQNNETELNYCSAFITYLQNEVIRDADDSYDKTVSTKLSELHNIH